MRSLHFSINTHTLEGVWSFISSFRIGRNDNTFCNLCLATWLRYSCGCWNCYYILNIYGIVRWIRIDSRELNSELVYLRRNRIFNDHIGHWWCRCYGNCFYTYSITLDANCTCLLYLLLRWYLALQQEQLQ